MSVLRGPRPFKFFVGRPLALRVAAQDAALGIRQPIGDKQAKVDSPPDKQATESDQLGHTEPKIPKVETVDSQPAEEDG